MKRFLNKGSVAPLFLITIFILSLIALAALLNGKVSFLNFASTQSLSQVIRGLPNDLWADRVIGKRDFGEIGPNKIVPNRVFRPGGTVVATASSTPGKLYVWDGGNSRILGIDLAKCYATNGPCSADIILGQASATDMGGCNNDSSFSSSPKRKQASASSLCGMPENTHTTLEDKSLVTMAVDKDDNLYVPDAFNHRILKFASPITSNMAAVEVWGQPNFESNGCNFTGDARSGLSGGPAPKPTATSMCFHSINGEGAAVAFDSLGNMWVADGGNNRILRFPKSGSTISKTPDFVLGQPNFTTGGDWSNGNGVGANTQFYSPQGLAFDKDNTLYVSDSGNDRVLKIPAPYTTSSVVLKDVPGGIITVINDSLNRGFWTRSNDIHSVFYLWDYSGNPITNIKVNNFGAGGFGFDKNHHLLVSTYDDQDVFELIPAGDGKSYTEGKSVFVARNVANLPDPSRFFHPAWGGVSVAKNQLIVAVDHLRFWNNPPNIPNGKDPDGFVGVASDNDRAQPEFGELAYDKDSTLWVTRLGSVEAYHLPLTTGATPFLNLSEINVLGGGKITLKNAMGVVALPQSKFIWVAENEQNRVLRIRDPLTNPVVDVILGQTSITGVTCNQGQIPARDSQLKLNMLCNPGMLSLDRKNNLYVSDHVIELAGNFRTLMFAATLFPDAPNELILAPNATKEFPRQGVSQDWAHLNFQAAFDSSNRMVIGNNPYAGFSKRYLEYYDDPTKVNSSNPSDPSYAEPTGKLKDYYGWPVGMVFDEFDNLYVYDANRGQVRIYFTPFKNNVGDNKTPTASFKSDKDSGKSPLTVRFTNLSTDPENDPLTFRWDFGDGQTSTATNPVHKFVVNNAPNDGKKVFTVNLTVTDSKGNRSAPFQKSISVFVVSNQKLDFSSTVVTSTKKRVDVKFNPTVSGLKEIASYNWKFGDKSGSTQKTPLHSYKNSGTYTVTLIVTDVTGQTLTVKKPVSVTLRP